VGKTKPTTKAKFASNPKVKSLVKKRNFYRKNVATMCKEWIEACKEVKLAREEAKEEAWTSFVEDLEDSTDSAKVWRVIRSLDGNPTSSAPNEGLKHGKNVLISNKAKADAFANHYANVSKLKFSASERAINRTAKRILDRKENEEAITPFSINELKAAVKKIKRRGAPGGDDIPPSFLKELGDKAFNELL